MTVLDRLRRALHGERRRIDLPHQIERRQQHRLGEQQARSDRVLLGVERVIAEARRAEEAMRRRA